MERLWLASADAQCPGYGENHRHFYHYCHGIEKLCPLLPGRSPSTRASSSPR